MSTRLFRTLIALTGFIGVAALMFSFSINPGPPAGATIPQIMAWGKANENLILAGAWFQAFGSLLNVIFILALIHMSDAGQKLSGWITAFAAIVIMGVSLVEVSFYISAIESGVAGDMTALSISLYLIKAIQHAYVIVPAPTLLIGLGIVLLNARLFPRAFSYIFIAFGLVMGILGLIGTFVPMQGIIDSVLAAQEVWFAITAIVLAVNARKVENGKTVNEQRSAVA